MLRLRPDVIFRPFLSLNVIPVSSPAVSPDLLLSQVLRCLYLDACTLNERPACIIWECVSKLSSYRGTVNERGTDVVKQACAQRGYITKFQNLDSALDNTWLPAIAALKSKGIGCPKGMLPSWDMTTQKTVFSFTGLGQGLDFGLPHSRGRTYGISIRTNGELDSASQAALIKKLDSAWEFVDRCKLKWIEPLHALWTRTRCNDSSPPLAEEKAFPSVCV